MHKPVDGAEAREYPHIRKVGRYAFYAVCGFGVGILVYAATRAIGLNKDVASFAWNIVAFASFLALRDIEKNAARTALETRNG